MAVAQTGWSGDGNWFWDGSKWNDSISQDGKWKFDGTTWQPFTGQRTPMPAQPPFPAPPAPAPATAPSAAASMPSWVAASEIQRMESQKIEARLAEMTAPEPIPPDRDWRLVGERMQYSDYSHNKSYASWRVGATSIVIYLLLLWFCGLFSVIFVWMTGWRTSSKALVTIISIVWFIVAVAVALSRIPQSTTG